MKKIINFVFIFSFLAWNIYAQNIELPDVTTVIEGESLKASAETVKESENPIVIQKGSGNLVPELPDEEIKEEKEQVQEIKKEVPEVKKGIHGNGLVGGGYPTSFTGDFSLFNSDKKNPFLLTFSHNSAIGYSGHSLTDGFYDRNTRFFVSKKITKEKYNFELGGSYSALSNGFQNHVEGISSLNLDAYNGNALFLYKFGNGFSAGTKGGVNFYNRYADVTKGEYPTLSFLTLNPEVFVTWHNESMNAGFSCNYTFGKDFSDSYDNVINRVKFNLNFAWHNSFLRAYADAGAIVGNLINDNPVVVPFKVGVNAFVPVSFSSRKIKAGVEGGISSNLFKPYELESKYRFTLVPVLPNEQSDWYGKLNVSIPAGDSFTGNFEVEYRQTAFENEGFVPAYVLPSYLGSYGYLYEKNQQLNTKFSLSYKVNAFVINGMWTSYWLDVPALKNENTVGLHVAYAKKDSRFSAEVSGSIAMNNKIEVPDLGMKVSVKITDAVKTEVQINDAIKLIKAEPRVYAGEYIGRGGNASLLLKFKF